MVRTLVIQLRNEIDAMIAHDATNDPTSLITHVAGILGLLGTAVMVIVADTHPIMID